MASGLRPATDRGGVAVGVEVANFGPCRHRGELRAAVRDECRVGAGRARRRAALDARQLARPGGEDVLPGVNLRHDDVVVDASTTGVSARASPQRLRLKAALPG